MKTQLLEDSVLEAMSCNVWPQVTNTKNIRSLSYITEFMKQRRQSGLKPREFIINNYSAQKYADAILKSIC